MTAGLRRFEKRSQASALQRTSLLLIALLAGSVVSQAQAPRKDPLTKYRQLWEESLVTVKPPPPEPEEEEKVTILDDYVLGGWTKTSQGYLVSLINTKNPKERRTIAPGMPNKEGFQVIDVKRDPLNYKSSQVLIQVGEDKKWIGYEDKFLTLQQPPAVQQQRNQSNQQAAQRAAQQRNQNQRQNQATTPPPGVKLNNNANANQQQKPAQRQPRVRRVPVPPKN